MQAPAPSGLGLPAAAAEPTDAGESVFFTTAFAEHGMDEQALVPWEARAAEVGARSFERARGAAQLIRLWKQDKYMRLLDDAAMQRLGQYFMFGTVAADRDIIRQDEYSNFMIVLLSGCIVVHRMQPWGERLKLNDARPGDILGEMSLLDSGKRFSVCTSTTDCEIAILDTQAMDDMMARDARLAASLVALLARKLSMRMRLVTARLTERRT